MKKRVFIIVLDSLGIGAAPDAAAFGDEGANTLRSIFNTGVLHIPNLTRLGLGCIDGIDYIEKTSPMAAYGRLTELSAGKDTVTGHFEMMGIVSKKPMPTYPSGFPREVLDAFREESGYEALCNLPYSGTEVIKDYGDEHMRSGRPIVYTSADSVFQIACHESLYPPEKLYDLCRRMRGRLVGAHGVGRVIARPFAGESGAYTRTANRRDFALPPPGKTVLDRLSSKGLSTVGVGKIGDIFAMTGISRSFPTHSNAEGMAKALELLDEEFEGLCFVNLVDFDMLYGHRQDAKGYALAVNEFDTHLGSFISKMKPTDALIITADHGCDPSDDSTDHSREYVPFLAYGDGIEPEDFGTVSGFSFVGEYAAELLLGNGD